MKHDVTADPLSPEMRAWVDKAAEEVVEYMNRRGRLTPPPPDPADHRPKVGQQLTDLEARVADLVARGWDDSDIGAALDALPQVVGRLKSNIAVKAAAPAQPRDYSPQRRDDEAD